MPSNHERHLPSRPDTRHRLRLVRLLIALLAAVAAIAAMLQEKAADTLDKVLFELSSQMKNAYSRSDA